MMLLDREIGQCVCVQDRDGRVRVTRADPIIHISRELLTAPNYPGIVIDGDLVTIGDIDTVTYRITEGSVDVVEAVRVA